MRNINVVKPLLVGCNKVSDDIDDRFLDTRSRPLYRKSMVGSVDLHQYEMTVISVYNHGFGAYLCFEL